MARSDVTAAIVGALREAGEPLSIQQIVDRLGISRPTASKYVAVAEASGLVSTYSFATARMVALSSSRRRSG